MRASLAVILVGYFVAGFLFFMKKEWAQAVRRHVGPESGRWIDFSPPTDKAYRVKLPGKESRTDTPLAGWELETYRFAPGRNGSDALSVAYEIAHGQPPAELREEVLPKSCRKRVSIEATVSATWAQYVGLDGVSLGIDRFGLSAPGGTVMKELKITAEHVVAAAKGLG